MQLNVTLKMTTARVVEMSVTVNYMHSLIQDIQTFPWRVCDAVNANMFRLYSSAICAKLYKIAACIINAYGCTEISPATFYAATFIELTNLHISRFRFGYCFVILIPGSYLLCKAFVYFGQSFAENSYVILNL